jgi:hypothetical protein
VGGAATERDLAMEEAGCPGEEQHEDDAAE